MYYRLPSFKHKAKKTDRVVKEEVDDLFDAELADAADGSEQTRGESQDYEEGRASAENSGDDCEGGSSDDDAGGKTSDGGSDESRKSRSGGRRRRESRAPPKPRSRRPRRGSFTPRKKASKPGSRAASSNRRSPSRLKMVIKSGKCRICNKTAKDCASDLLKIFEYWGIAQSSFPSMGYFLS